MHSFCIRNKTLCNPVDRRQRRRAKQWTVSQSFLPRLINPSEIMFSRGVTEIHHNVGMFDWIMYTCHAPALEDKTDSGINSDITYYFQRAVEMDCFLFALPKKEVAVQNN